VPKSAFQGKERRTWPRRRKQFRVFLADAADETAEPIATWIVNLSPGGLRLCCKDEVEGGTILKVRPAGAPRSMDWIPVEVRNSQPTDSGWELGCQFVRTPSLATLLLFG
jgi:hypothetical protein